MNNTDKLLRAFIEASGFEIEELVDTKLTPISKQPGMNRIAAGALAMRCNELVTVNGNEYKRGDDECYYLKPNLDIDYKVTKPATKEKAKSASYECKEHPVPIDVDGCNRSVCRFCGSLLAIVEGKWVTHENI